MKKDIFKVADKSLKSRLIVGTGKYKSFLETAKAIKASVQYGNCSCKTGKYFGPKKPLLSDYINPKKIIFLPNTAGCFTSEEALRTLN